MRRLVNTKIRYSIFLLTFIFFLLTFSCFNNARVFEKEKLFDLGIGKMEKQLNLMLKTDSTRFIRDNYVNLNGLFYIANSRSNKVMELTSYGDLLSLYYDPETNPEPVTLVKEKEDKIVSNLNAYPHSFQNLGLITVDSRKVLMVDEQISQKREVLDQKNGIPLNRIIKRFDADGKVIDYLGQEGVGGTPFPFIHSLHIGKEDRLSVVCRNVGNWDVFIFDRDGQLIKIVYFDESKLPTTVENRVAALENIYADYNNSRLFLKINFYEKRFGKGAGAMGFTLFVETSVWVYDLSQDKFVLHFDLPKKHVQNEWEKNFRREVLYDLIGLDHNGNLFFLSPHEKGLSEILIINNVGQVIEKVYIKLNEKELFFRQFFVSPEGIVSALLCYTERAEISWWRTDAVVRRN